MSLLDEMKDTFALKGEVVTADQLTDIIAEAGQDVAITMADVPDPAAGSKTYVPTENGTYANWPITGGTDGAEPGGATVDLTRGRIEIIGSVATGFKKLVNEIDVSGKLDKGPFNGNAGDLDAKKAGISPSTNLFDSSLTVKPYTAGMTYSETGIIWGATMQPDGTLAANDTYFVTDFITLLQIAGQLYTAKADTTRAAYIRFRSVFDSAKAPITSGGSTTSHSQFGSTAPYTRLTLWKVDFESFRLNAAATAGDWQPAGKVLVNDVKATGKSIYPAGDIRYFKKTDKVTAANTDFIATTVNDLDLAAITPNKYVVGSTGALATPSGGVEADTYFATGFIARKVLDGVQATHIRMTWGHQIAFYTAAGEASYVSGQASLGANALVAWPTTGMFLRAGQQTALKDTSMIVQGDSTIQLPSTYQPHNLLNNVSVVGLAEKAAKDTLLLLEIPEICIAVGTTYEIYNNQIAWCGNPDNYHFFWTGAGKSMARKWQCTGTSGNVGSYTLNLKVFDNNMVQVASKNYSLRIVAATISAPIAIGQVGDSLDNYKAWQTALLNKSAQLSLVGTRWGNGASTIPYRHEGRSGWSAAQYIADSTYTYTNTNGEPNNGAVGADGRAANKNPFWNPATSQLDWAYYKSNYGLNPTKLLVWLGTNGIELDPTTNATNIKVFLDGLIATGLNIPIFVVNTLYRGNQDGLANQGSTDGFTSNPAWKLQEDRKVFNLHNKLVELLGGYTNLHFIPVSAAHDSANNFTPDPSTAAAPYNAPTPVNPHAWQTEYLPNEATHPQLAGYQQIADVIFSHVVANQ